MTVLPTTITLTQLKAINTVALGVEIEDVAALVQELERTEAFGVFFDPTAWMRTRDTRGALKEVARAFLAYRRALEQYKPVEEER